MGLVLLLNLPCCLFQDGPFHSYCQSKGPNHGQLDSHKNLLQVGDVRDLPSHRCVIQTTLMCPSGLLLFRWRDEGQVCCAHIWSRAGGDSLTELKLEGMSLAGCGSGIQDFCLKLAPGFHCTTVTDIVDDRVEGLGVVFTL